jgi:branched-subunit amino acid ABC-type transport system permease component
MRAFLPYLVIGITAGSIYGLCGVGLVLTYRTSGVFNFAHGALGTVGAYLFYELWSKNHVPWPLALVICVGLLSLVFGAGLEQLARRLGHATPAVTVVATIGLLLLVDGITTVRYGAATLTLPAYLPTSGFRFGGVNIGWDQTTVVLVGVACTAALTLLLAKTRSGVAMRGVVEAPELMELTGFNARQVRQLAWTIGSAVAVLSGILIAPSIGLNPLTLTFLVVQAFGAAAIGRFRSLPWTFAGGWVIGIGSGLGQKYATNYPVLLGLPSSMAFFVLFIVLVAARSGTLPREVIVKRPHLEELTKLPLPIRAGLAGFGAVVVIAIPSLVGAKLPVFISAAGFVIVFLSLGLLVKVAGQVSLCHGAFVAVGAVVFSHLNTGLGVPWPIALVIAGLVTVPVGALVALPAVRLSGVYLALATFAFALLAENLVYRTFLLFGAEGHQVVGRPSLLSSDRNYFYVAIVVAVVAAVAMVFIQRSRLGRLLGALSDSPVALTTFGTSATTTLILVFAIAAFFAGVAGAVLAAGTQAAGPADVGSLQSLLWVAIIAISGNRLVRSSVVAALLLAVLPAYLPGSWTDYQPIGFGVLAVVAALLAASQFDPVARIKADLTASIRSLGRGPRRTAAVGRSRRPRATAPTAVATERSVA